MVCVVKINAVMEYLKNLLKKENSGTEAHVKEAKTQEQAQLLNFCL